MLLKALLIASPFLFGSDPLDDDADRLARLRDDVDRGRATTREVLIDPRYADLHAEDAFRGLIRRHPPVGKIRIVGESEPGTPLEIDGVVSGSAGEPVPGALVYVYQTDEKGEYGVDSRHARIFGYVKTDSEGRFSVRTIRPAGYPGETIPQHVHFEVYASGFATLVTEILFEDDPRLDAEGRRFAENGGYPIVTPEHGKDGALRAACSFVLTPRRTS